MTDWPEKWKGKTWKSVDEYGFPATITEDALRGAYDAIGDDGNMTKFLTELGQGYLSNRVCDRALQLLRKAGLLTYDRATKCWKKT